jgi:hypothetical protein
MINCKTSVTFAVDFFKMKAKQGLKENYLFLHFCENIFSFFSENCLRKYTKLAKIYQKS